MEIFGTIWRMHLRDKDSLHEIAKLMGLARSAIRSWLRSPAEAAPPTYRRRKGLGKLTAIHEALEQALKVDAHRIKQNRHIAKALFIPIQYQG